MFRAIATLTCTAVSTSIARNEIRTIAVATATEDARIAGVASAITLGTDLLHVAISLTTNVALSDVEDRENALDGEARGTEVWQVRLVGTRVGGVREIDGQHSQKGAEEW